MNDNDKVDQIYAGVSQPTCLGGLQRSSGTGDFIDDVDLTKLISMSHDYTAGNVDNHAAVSKYEQLLQKLNPEIPTAFPANQGIRIEETAGADDIKVKIFSNRVGNNSVFFSGPKML